VSQPKKGASVPKVQIAAGVVRSIRQHARSSMKAEVCGVLIGTEEGGAVVASACIEGVNAAQGGAHVTFTQETWEHIYQIKDKDYPEERIVGWYHSHPAFGIFLSEHDLFIHQNFFSSPLQIAWVYDPASDEEGCFGWIGGKIERLTRITVRDGEEDRGAVGVTPHDEMLDGEEEQEDWSLTIKQTKKEEESLLMTWVGRILTHALALTVGVGLALLLLAANLNRAFDEGYVSGIGDLAHGSLRIPRGMSVQEFLDKTGIDPNKLRPAGPVNTLPPPNTSPQQPQGKKP
jgi:proteasome lid subunit RPN8/RPN11